MAEKRRAKRTIRACYRNIDRALEKLKLLEDMFSDHESHAKYAELLDGVAKGLFTTQEFLSVFYRLAWGQEPGDWYSDA